MGVSINPPYTFGCGVFLNLFFYLMTLSFYWSAKILTIFRIPFSVFWKSKDSFFIFFQRKHSLLRYLLSHYHSAVVIFFVCFYTSCYFGFVTFNIDGVRLMSCAGRRASATAATGVSWFQFCSFILVCFDALLNTVTCYCCWLSQTLRASRLQYFDTLLYLHYYVLDASNALFITCTYCFVY